jgi:hypothetical protein
MDQAPGASSKRPRDNVGDDEFGQPDPKRPAEATVVEPPTDPTYLIVHSVRCQDDSRGSYHSRHKEHEYYLDVPRLFARDSKANGLRGTSINHIPDLESFLVENPDYDFVVEKNYNCEAYYKDYEKEFQDIGDSKLRSNIASESRPFLYSLPEDLPLATPEDESITHFSQGMADALDALDDICQWDGLFETDDPYDLKLPAPYTNIYQSRTALNDYQEREIDPIHWPQIDSFLDYVLGAMSDDYAEADACFERCETTSRHLAKLYRIGDILVTQKHGEEIGLLCDSALSPAPQTCVLQCQSWTFDGAFRKKTETLQVTWPADSAVDTISILSLQVYPLRFGGEELRKRLRGRGQKLWDCRFRKFVSYNDSESSSGIQAVSLRQKLYRPVIDLEQTNLRFMVDMSTYKILSEREVTESRDMTSRPQDSLADAAMHAEELPGDDFLLTLPTKVPGFGFHNKRWGMYRYFSEPSRY